MSSPLHVVTTGQGPRCVLVHGSAAEHVTWNIQLAGALRDRFTLQAYDRRGTGRSPGDPDASVEAHADDLLELIGDDRVLAVGSSFGAVCVLAAARRAPARFHGVVLCEPPLAPSDDAPAVPEAFLARFDELVATAGGEAAAEFFLRTVLTDAIYDRIPRAFQARSQALWRQIRGDSRALGAYRVDYAGLRAVEVPALLLGGARSAPYYRPTLEALAAALPRARLALLAGAGHMMHAEAPRAFADHLLAFAAEVGCPPAPARAESGVP